MAIVSGSPTKLADHNDEEHSAFVPSSEPADPPIINVITQRHPLAKPKELRPNAHGKHIHVSVAENSQLRLREAACAR
jgi:hypothetical protein